MTQGKENLNAILGTKIHFKKEGLRFVPKNKKKHDVTTVTFIPEKNGAKKNLLIKLNGFFKDKPTQNPTHVSSFKGKEKMGELKFGQTKSNKIQKITMTGLKSSQNKHKNKQTRKSEVFIKSNQNTNFQQKSY